LRTRTFPPSGCSRWQEATAVHALEPHLANPLHRFGVPRGDLLCLKLWLTRYARQALFRCAATPSPVRLITFSSCVVCGSVPGRLGGGEVSGARRAQPTSLRVTSVARPLLNGYSDAITLDCRSRVANGRCLREEGERVVPPTLDKRWHDAVTTADAVPAVANACTSSFNRTRGSREVCGSD